MSSTEPRSPSSLSPIVGRTSSLPTTVNPKLLNCVISLRSSYTGLYPQS